MRGSCGPSHCDDAGRVGEEIEQAADRPPPPADRQAFEDLGDENEEHDDERGEELPDADGGSKRDGHRQLHRHPAFQNVLQGLLENRPATYQGDENADHTHVGKRLPQSEPDGGRAQSDHPDAEEIGPFYNGMLVGMRRHVH